MTFILVRDHLEQAHAILREQDSDSTKLREMLDLVIGALDHLQSSAPYRRTNVIDFPQRSHPGPSARS